MAKKSKKKNTKKDQEKEKAQVDNQDISDVEVEYNYNLDHLTHKDKFIIMKIVEKNDGLEEENEKEEQSLQKQEKFLISKLEELKALNERYMAASMGRHKDGRLEPRSKAQHDKPAFEKYKKARQDLHPRFSQEQQSSNRRPSRATRGAPQYREDADSSSFSDDDKIEDYRVESRKRKSTDRGSDDDSDDDEDVEEDEDAPPVQDQP
ncbi:uncharacterized protein [Miscanthus floridulus]|uniref:uncharacterized protein n=1 Tax=Miscanthus floridulus TaxID=154761 RepID=UPI0034596AF9